VVEPVLLKRHKRKKIALIGGSIASIGLIVLIILSFLGQRLGSFTISINSRGNAAISIYDNHLLKNPTTFLKIGDISEFTCYSATFLDNDEKIDTDESDFTYGAKRDKQENVKFFWFLKYTFYLKNVGKRVIDYAWTIKVSENVAPTNVDYDIIDVLRIRVYKNDGTQHEAKTYAEKSLIKRIDEQGNETYNSPVAGELHTEDYRGFAEPFASRENLVDEEVKLFQPGQVTRYTVVVWLEGLDEYAVDDQPENCYVRFGVDISGYDTVETVD